MSSGDGTAAEEGEAEGDRDEEEGDREDHLSRAGNADAAAEEGENDGLGNVAEGGGEEEGGDGDAGDACQEVQGDVAAEREEAEREGGAEGVGGEEAVEASDVALGRAAGKPGSGPAAGEEADPEDIDGTADDLGGKGEASAGPEAPGETGGISDGLAGDADGAGEAAKEDEGEGALVAGLRDRVAEPGTLKDVSGGGEGEEESKGARDLAEERHYREELGSSSVGRRARRWSQATPMRSKMPTQRRSRVP